MNASLRGLSIVYVIGIIVLFEVPESSEVWWTLPAKVVLILVSGLPAVPGLFMEWAVRRPLIALVTAAVIGGYGTASVITVALIGFSPGHGGAGFMKVLLVMLVVEAALTVCWSVIWFRTVQGTSRAILATIIAGPALAWCGFAFFFQPFDQRPPWYLSLDTLQGFDPHKSLVKIDACAWLYRDANGKFPAQLSDIQQWQPECLNGVFPEAHGRVWYTYSTTNNGFQIRMGFHSSMWTKVRYGNDFGSDESGLVWMLINPQNLYGSIGPQRFKSYVDCLQKAPIASGATLREIITERKCKMEDQFVSDNEIKTYKARILLAKVKQNGDFMLEFRPFSYGDVLMRSYMADQTGKIHATPENRPATSEDSPADSREF